MLTFGLMSERVMKYYALIERWFIKEKLTFRKNSR